MYAYNNFALTHYFVCPRKAVPCVAGPSGFEICSDRDDTTWSQKLPDKN